jgi:hypothetical protein
MGVVLEWDVSMAFRLRFRAEQYGRLGCLSNVRGEGNHVPGHFCKWSGMLFGSPGFVF